MGDPSTVPDHGGKVEITVLKAIGLSRLGRLAGDDQYYVQVSLGEQSFQTKNKRRSIFGSVPWNQTFTFNFNGEMPHPTLEVYGRPFSKRGHDFVGCAKVPYADLNVSDITEVGVSKAHDLPLADKDGKPITTPKIPTLKILVKTIALGVQEQIDDLTPILKQASNALDRLKQASDTLDRLKGPNIPDLPEQAGAAGSAIAIVGTILGKISALADIMDEVTKIHLYAKAAWDILDLTRKVIKAQMEEDENIRDLFKQMDSFSGRIQSYLAKLDTITLFDKHTSDAKDVLHRVANTSRECAEFMIRFCDSNFGKRAMKCALFGNASETIKKYGSTFGSLEEEFNKKVWDDTNINVHRIREDQTAGQVAEFMVHSASLLTSNNRTCFPGTQVAIRKKIADWIDSAGEEIPRVLLLSGLAGTGKSTIAYTVASELTEQNKHCTSFAFNRRAQPPPAARMLFPHIAAYLAAFYPAVKKALIEKKEIASGVDLERQLRELVIEPLKQPRPNAPAPIVIVIDALDEADDGGVQAPILASLLATACDELPANIRIFVTSRAESYPMENMWQSAIRCLAMPDSSNESLAEVRLFIQDQLQGVEGMNEIRFDTLMTTSQGLFQWAATACNEIKTPLRGESTPYQTYEMVVASGVGRDQSELLDSLYEGVLARAYDPEKNPDGHRRLKTVIAALFVLMEPLTLDTFGQLLGEGSDAEATLLDLVSIMDGISDRTRPVQPNHTSLRDFFLDPRRSGPFCIKDLLPDAHSHAARTSLTIVLTCLGQNISTVDFSGLDHGNAMTEADRVQRDIPPHVEYACLHWVKHLAEAPTPEEAFWTNMVKFFAENQVLLWIEVFSLLVVHRLRDTYRNAPPELSGCIGLLAYLMMIQGTTCPHFIWSAAEFISKIVDAEIVRPPQFNPLWTLRKLGEMYRLVSWTVQLQRQPKDGPLVTIGSGFFIDLPGISYDVVLTTASSMVDFNCHPHTDLVISIPTQVPRLDGVSQFSDVQFPVPSTDIYVCASFGQRRELETDWGAILLPRGTARGAGFEFDIAKLGDTDQTITGIYGTPSCVPHRFRLPIDSSNDSAYVTHTARTQIPFEYPVASGAPIYILYGYYHLKAQIQGICNPIYGDEEYTKLTLALVRELGLWVGIGRYNAQIRWLPPTLYTTEFEESDAGDVPNVENDEHSRILLNQDNLYLYVNEEDLRLYLKRDSGSSFNINCTGSHSWTLGFDSLVVDSVDADDEDNGEGRLAGVATSHYDGQSSLFIRMEDQQTREKRLQLNHVHSFFDVDSTPITNSSHGELFKISLRGQWNTAKQVTRHRRLDFVVE